MNGETPMKKRRKNDLETTGELIELAYEAVQLARELLGERSATDKLQIREDSITERLEGYSHDYETRKRGVAPKKKTKKSR